MLGGYRLFGERKWQVAWYQAFSALQPSIGTGGPEYFCFAIKQPQFDCRSQCRIRDPLSCRGGVDATRRSLPGQGVNRGTHRNSCASGHVLRYRHNNLGLGRGRTLDCLSVYWDRHLRIWCDGCGPGAQQSRVSLKPTRGAGNYFCAAGRWFLRRQFLGSR
ncbi:hypothetical protein D3C79_783310 [compost metagenome]